MGTSYPPDGAPPSSATRDVRDLTEVRGGGGAASSVAAYSHRSSRCALVNVIFDENRARRRGILSTLGWLRFAA
jgi:hypothetical protein